MSTPTYTLTINSSPYGTTDPAAGTYTYPAETFISITAIPNEGYKFDYWIVNGDQYTINPIEGGISGDATVTPYFSAIAPSNWTLNISASTGGTVNPAGIISGAQGTSTPLISAVANEGYVFDSWLLDGVTTYTENPISLIIDDAAAHTLQAIFRYQGATAILGYDQTPGSNTVINANEIIGSTFQSPASGYLQSIVVYLADVSSATRLKCLLYRASDLALIGETQERIGGMIIGWNIFQFLTSPAVVQGASYILALYSAGGYTQYGTSYLGVNNEQHSAGTYPTAPNPLVVGTLAPPRTLSIYSTVQGTPVVYYSLSISSTTGGTTNPVSGIYQEVSGTTITVTASANPGYVFDHWELDGTNAGTSTSITVTMDGNHVLQAVFVAVAPTQFTLTVNSTPITGVPVTVEAV